MGPDMTTAMFAAVGMCDADPKQIVVEQGSREWRQRDGGLVTLGLSTGNEEDRQGKQMVEVMTTTTTMKSQW